MKKNVKLTIIGALVLVVIIVLSSSFFTVSEYESAIVRRFGSIQTVYVASGADALKAQLAGTQFAGISIHDGAGLKLRLPFVDEIGRASCRERV